MEPEVIASLGGVYNASIALPMRKMISKPLGHPLPNPDLKVCAFEKQDTGA
jgi:hypothetical protein